MAESAIWWLTLQLLAILSIVPALLLFRSLPDRGYSLAKALGILLPAYILWILGWTGVLPNGRFATFVAALAVGAASVVYTYRKQLLRPLASFLQDNWRTVLATELVFAVSFFGFTLLRSFHPDIAGTEQPMDFGLLNAILRSDYFPPNDPWLSGRTISYYYFGYLIQTIPLQLTGIPSGIGYNLAMAGIFAMTVTGAFSLGYNLVAGRSFRAGVLTGVLAAVLLAVAGNLQGGLELVRARNLGSPELWQWIGVNGALAPYSSSSWFPTEHFWWWHATRVINTLRIQTAPDGSILAVDDRADYTITEFPSFTFILGDMHPHMMALPFALMALGLALNFLRRDQALGPEWLRREPLGFLAAALVLGALGFINSWDFPTYLAVTMGAILLGAARLGGLGWPVLGAMAALAAASVLLYLPFYLGPKPVVHGPGIVGAAGTSPVHFFIVWGLFLFVLASFFGSRLLSVVRESRARPHLALGCLAIALMPLVLWAAGQFFLQRLAGIPGVSGSSAIGKELSAVPLVLTVALLLFLVISPRLRGGLEQSYLVLLALVGFALTLGTELFFLRDIFGNRMNSMFKFYYQAWVLFAIASAYGIYWVTAKLRASGRGPLLTGLWSGALAVLLIWALAYPVAASYTRMDMFTRAPGLDGLAFLRAVDAGEYAAISWLNSNVAGAPTIVEAPGGSYTDFGRVSSSTGLPAVIQWPGHEVQWRGGIPELAERERDVGLIYTSDDKVLVQRLLQKYQVRYVYVGRQERDKYGDAAIRRFTDMLDVAFQDRGVTIFQVRS